MKKIMIILVAIASLIILPIYAESKEYTAGFMRTAPVIDGDINNDPSWQHLNWMNGFKKYKLCTRAERKTRFKIGYTYDGLYLAIDCSEPAMNKISSTRKDMEDVWNDDNIELFVATGKLKYRHFVVNVAGAKYNEMMNKGKKLDSTYLWGWKAKVKHNPKSWSVEIMIPYYLLVFFPDPKLKVGFNICRTATPIDEISSWAPQKLSFHNVENFGTLRFSGKLSKDELNKLAITRSRQHLIAGSEILKHRWQKLKQKITQNNDPYYKLFIKSYDNVFEKLNKTIKSLDSPTQEKYQTAQEYFEKFKQKIIEFDSLYGEKIINKLTTQYKPKDTQK